MSIKSKMNPKNIFYYLEPIEDNYYIEIGISLSVGAFIIVLSTLACICLFFKYKK